MQTIEIAGRSTPPEWALRQRRLMAEMDRAAPRFVAKYTRDDGTFIWRDEWPGMDGSDDGYEAFFSIPLLYSLGGPEHLHTIARKQWQARAPPPLARPPARARASLRTTARDVADPLAPQVPSAVSSPRPHPLVSRPPGPVAS